MRYRWRYLPPGNALSPLSAASMNFDFGRGCALLQGEERA